MRTRGGQTSTGNEEAASFTSQMLESRGHPPGGVLRYPGDLRNRNSTLQRNQARGFTWPTLGCCRSCETDVPGISASNPPRQVPAADCQVRRGEARGLEPPGGRGASSGSGLLIKRGGARGRHRCGHVPARETVWRVGDMEKSEADRDPAVWSRSTTHKPYPHPLRHPASGTREPAVSVTPPHVGREGLCQDGVNGRQRSWSGAKAGGL